VIWMDGALNTTDLKSHPQILSVPEVFPNPSSGNIHFYYYLYNKVDVKILIYNMLGQPVEVYEAQQTNGSYHWIWNKPAAIGTYFYQIWQGDAIWQSGKLMIQ
jgi:Secretion system C-terminal sorting domain